MKEYYIAFSVSVFCVIPVMLAGNIPLSHPLNAFAIASAGFFIRGISLIIQRWIPVPLLGDVRAKFEDAHPEVVGMDYSKKKQIFKEWEMKNKVTKPAH